jgi:Cu/Ag efflux pump CusA
MRTRAMPVAVIGGLLTSTFLTLVVIPIVYEFYENFKNKKKLKAIK